MKSLSVVVPCFNEEENIKPFYEKFMELRNKNKILKKMLYEIIFIDDGSNDGTERKIRGLKKSDNAIRLIKFSRNFGKESAMLAGLRASKMDLVCILDCDLQDPLELLITMLEKYRAHNGALKMIIAKRKNRTGEGKIRAYLSNLFYKFNNMISKVKLVSGVRDFRLMSREVVESIIKMNEYHRFSKAIFEFVGYKREYLEYDYIERAQGSSKWSFWKLFSYAIEGIISFSVAPLKFITLIGIIIFLLSSIYGLFIIIQTLIFGNDVKGYPSTIVLISFFGGLQIIMLGIIGEYIARIYEQGKNRPHYLIECEE